MNNFKILPSFFNMWATKFLLLLWFGSILAEDCELIRNFVGDYARFIKQMSIQTYPVNKFCSSNDTVAHYESAFEWFNYAKANESCAAEFNHNRLNIVQTLYDQMTSIWENAHCADCVSNQNDTAEFLKLYDSQLNCTKVSKDPCNVCAGNYTKLQQFYEDLVKSRQGIVCFDIEDRMNQTRYAWSAVYNCCKGKQHSQKAFIWFASGISGLPVVFYIAMYFITQRKEARERAAAPPLNDQTVGQPEEEPPQEASTSQQVRQKHFDAGSDQCSVGDEPKLNNLNIAPGVRESKLIDFQDSGSEHVHSVRDLKMPSTKHDDVDDVSLLE